MSLPKSFEFLVAQMLIKINSRFKLVLLGDGRSGTTWIAEVLNFDGKFLNFFETFHGKKILELTDNRLYPTEKDLDELIIKSTRMESYATAERHFAGIQRPVRFPYAGSIIKDISSHLILKRIHSNEQKILVILRNPISVAVSKERYGKWQSEGDIGVLTGYSSELKDLATQCLSEQMITSHFLNYVLVWSLLHRIILSCLRTIDFSLVFYEELLRTPEQSFGDLFSQIGLHERYTKNKDKIMNCLRKKSRTTAKNDMIRIGLVDDQPWRELKTDSERSIAYHILKIFGLYEVYEDSLMPKIKKRDLTGITSRWR